MRFFDLFLWAQLGKVSLHLISAALIMFTERLLHAIMFFSSLLLPVGVLDFFRHQWIKSAPRLLKGFRDPNVLPEMSYTTPELCRSRGYPCEEHYIKTSDGFLLGVHRIPTGKLPISKSSLELARSPDYSLHSPSYSSLDEASEGSGSASARNEPTVTIAAINGRRPVAFVMHGFLQSSEAYVSTTYSLPFALADAGFDVWLGNCRGNKYSCKHERHDPDSNEYWDFCLDEIARIDIPAVLTYILTHTGVDSLSYIGFSQGTAAAFAAFSTNAEIAKRVNIFCAMGPATALKGFSNSVVDALTRSSPHIVYLILGKRRLLPSTLFWQSILSVSALIRTIDASVKFLFGWSMKNVHPKDKGLHYAHIYSYSSVKTVVQWFQIMNSGHFQMYDDHRWRTQNSKTYIQPRYPIHQIACPISIFYGGRDELPDTQRLIESLPDDSIVHEEPTFEHLDFMYSRESAKRVYPRIVELATRATTHYQLHIDKYRQTIQSLHTDRSPLLPSASADSYPAPFSLPSFTRPPMFSSNAELLPSSSPSPSLTSASPTELTTAKPKSSGRRKYVVVDSLRGQGGLNFEDEDTAAGLESFD